LRIETVFATRLVSHDIGDPALEAAIVKRRGKSRSR
jgi:hypothetical protein